MDKTKKKVKDLTVEELEEVVVSAVKSAVEPKKAQDVIKRNPDCPNTPPVNGRGLGFGRGFRNGTGRRGWGNK